MKIYTKKGDSGQTSLIGGTRVPKNALRIECYGTIDELNSYLGVIRDHPIDLEFIQQLIHIQDRLFTLGSMLASDPEKSKMKLPAFTLSDVEDLENWMDAMESKLPEMKFFVLPGGHLAVSHTHVARCICRRAERLIVKLMVTEKCDPLIEQYMNRLSDYLFVLSRKLTQDFNAPEQPWHPKMD